MHSVLTIPDKRPFKPVQLLDDEVDEILASCRESLCSGALSGGPVVKELERSFAAHGATEHAVAVSSGTDALEALLRAVGVGGRKVLVPTNTFAATAFAVIRAGGHLVFVDMDPRTLAPAPAQVERAIERHGGELAALVLVHLGGFIGDATAELAALCGRHNLAIVEDAAHAHGSRYRGEAPGTWSAGAAYSFFATKVMTSGEGGMIVTNRDDVASFVRSYRDQGRDATDPLVNVLVGTNARMSELHAAIGLAELRRLDAVVDTRRRVARHYDALLEGLPGVRTVRPVDGCEPNYYKYLVVFDDEPTRAAFRSFAADHGLPLPSGVYDLPLHRQPVFADCHDGTPLPQADDFCTRHVALPVTRTMDRPDAEAVAAVVETFACRAPALEH